MFECPPDAVCAAGRCRAWPDDSAWTSIEHDSFDSPPDLPDWLVTVGRCGSVELVGSQGAEAARFSGPMYARRALRFGEGAASAASVRFRALGAANAELTLFAMAGGASAGIAGGVRASVAGETLRITLANGAVVYERPRDDRPTNLRVERDEARDRLRVLVDGAAVHEASLRSFVLLGTHLQLQSQAACGQPTFELQEVRTWSAQ